MKPKGRMEMVLLLFSKGDFAPANMGREFPGAQAATEFHKDLRADAEESRTCPNVPPGAAAPLSLQLGSVGPAGLFLGFEGEGVGSWAWRGSWVQASPQARTPSGLLGE